MILQRLQVLCRFDFPCHFYQLFKFKKRKIVNTKPANSSQKSFLEDVAQNLQLTSVRSRTISGRFLPTTIISFTKLRFRRSFSAPQNEPQFCKRYEESCQKIRQKWSYNRLLSVANFGQHPLV